MRSLNRYIIGFRQYLLSLSFLSQTVSCLYSVLIIFPWHLASLFKVCVGEGGGARSIYKKIFRQEKNPPINISFPYIHFLHVINIFFLFTQRFIPQRFHYVFTAIKFLSFFLFFKIPVSKKGLPLPDPALLLLT